MSITTAIMYSGQITHNSEACIGFFSVGSFQNPLLYTYYGCFQKLGVTPQIIHFNMVFHFLSPSIFGGPVSLCFPSFWENIHMGRGWRGLSSPTWQTGLSQRHHRGLGNLMTSIVGCWSQMKCRIKLPTDDFWMFFVLMEKTRVVKVIFFRVPGFLLRMILDHPRGISISACTIRWMTLLRLDHSVPWHAKWQSS